MATASDADLILKLYDLRREATMRKARLWMASEFDPLTIEDIHIAISGMGSEKSQYWRQVTSYWEMAASLVLRGALDGDLFLDSKSGGLRTLAKFDHFRGDYEKVMGEPFMPRTAELVDKYPAAREQFEAVRKHWEERRAGR